MSILDLSLAGETSLSVRRLSVQEGISKLFTLSVVARTEDPSVNLEAIVGKPAALRVEEKGSRVTFLDEPQLEQPQGHGSS